MNLRLATIFVSAALAIGAAQAQDHTLEQLVIEMANTPAEHNAVSKHYASEATAARQQAQRHRDMARTYATTRNAQPQMQRHCEQIARKYEEIASEYDQLSQFHADEAKKAAH